MISVVVGAAGTMEDTAVLHSDAEAPGNEAVTGQTSSNIPCNSVAEAFDCDTDLTAETTVSVVRDSDSVEVFRKQSKKQNVIVCKLIHSGGRFSMLNVFLV